MPNMDEVFELIEAGFNVQIGAGYIAILSDEEVVKIIGEAE